MTAKEITKSINLGFLLLLALGVASCAVQSPPPAREPVASVSLEPRKPDPVCVARCKRHLEEALKVCDDLFNSPRSQHYKDQEWRRQCQEQAKTQYDICVNFCEK
jgi:hypothetical protein